MFAEFDKEG